MGSSTEFPITTAPTSPEPERAVNKVSGAKASWPWHLINFSPFLLLMWFTARFGVNVPVIDEWAWAYWFHAVRFKQAIFDDLFVVSNDHRIVFPKLIWTPLAFAAHGNLRVEMMANLVPALITFLVFYQLALLQTNYAGRSLIRAATLSTSVLVFSLTQYETWLWGLTGAYLIAQAAFALAVGVCFIGRLRPWTRFGLAAFFCFVASFSLAWGLSSWLALLPCIAGLPAGGEKARKLFVWCLLFAASLALYSHHFRFLALAEENTQMEFLHHPLRSADFFTALVGLPFCATDSANFAVTARLFGAIILLALLACFLALRNYERRDIIAPWLSVALYGLFFAVLVTVGRSARGLVAANQSRYVTGTMLVSIAVIQLGRLVYARKESRVYVFLLGALWALLTAGSVNALSAAHQLKEERSRGKLFLEVLRYIDAGTDDSPESLTAALYTGSEFRAPAELLNEIGFLHLASGIDFGEDACPDCGRFEAADGSGDLMHLRRHKDEVTVSGWASLPGGRGLPKIVLISYGTQRTFIAGAVVGRVNRPDMAALKRDPRYVHSGWSASFPAKFLPMGEGRLKAWVYDSAQKRFVRLPETGGEKMFRVESK